MTKKMLLTSTCAVLGLFAQVQHVYGMLDEDDVPQHAKAQLPKKAAATEAKSAISPTSHLQFQPAEKCVDGWDLFGNTEHLNDGNPKGLFLVHTRDHFQLSLLSRDDTLPLELRGDKKSLLEMLETEAQNVREKPLIPTSLVSSQHPDTFYNRSGFVISMKPGHILAMGPGNLNIAPQPGYETPINQEHAKVIIGENPPRFSPEELMKRTEKSRHNEVVLRPLDDEGEPIGIRAVFLQKPDQDDDQWGNTHERFNQALREYAAKNQLRIVDFTTL